MSFRVLFLICGLALTSSISGAAPSSASRSRVVQLVKQAAEHYAEGQFQQAITLLEQAYELEPNPTILYNIARAHESKGDPAPAIEAYEKYIAANEKAEDRGAVLQRIETLKRQIAEKEELARQRTLAAASAKRAESSPPPRDPGQAAPAEPRKPSAAPWILAGIGAAVVGGGVFLGLRARSKSDDAQDAQFASDSVDQHDDAKSLALIANITLAAGGALTIGGLSWGIADWIGASNTTPSAAGVLSAPVVTVAGRF